MPKQALPTLVLSTVHGQTPGSIMPEIIEVIVHFLVPE